MLETWRQLQFSLCPVILTFLLKGMLFNAQIPFLLLFIDHVHANLY
jgi:hypothetical protein